MESFWDFGLLKSPDQRDPFPEVHLLDDRRWEWKQKIEEATPLWDIVGTCWDIPMLGKSSKNLEQVGQVRGKLTKLIFFMETKTGGMFMTIQGFFCVVYPIIYRGSTIQGGAGFCNHPQ